MGKSSDGLRVIPVPNDFGRDTREAGSFLGVPLLVSDDIPPGHILYRDGDRQWLVEIPRPKKDAP
jgi:hypothetical protein